MTIKLENFKNLISCDKYKQKVSKLGGTVPTLAYKIKGNDTITIGSEYYQTFGGTVVEFELINLINRR